MSDAILVHAGRPAVTSGAATNGQTNDALAEGEEEEEAEADGGEVHAGDGADEAMVDAAKTEQGQNESAAEQGLTHDPEDRYVAEEDEGHRCAQRLEWPLLPPMQMRPCRIKSKAALQGEQSLLLVTQGGR